MRECIPILFWITQGPELIPRLLSCRAANDYVAAFVLELLLFLIIPQESTTEFLTLFRFRLVKALNRVAVLGFYPTFSNDCFFYSSVASYNPMHLVIYLFFLFSLFFCPAVFGCVMLVRTNWPQGGLGAEQAGVTIRLGSSIAYPFYTCPDDPFYAVDELDYLFFVWFSCDAVSAFLPDSTLQ